ncbi:protein-tyrosine phosphatase domain-containing protein [Phthorimaea operculella]|nr:protein-tyrosine phosphatase domain-containing protein [Phthorimaea operculella]
MRHTKVRLIRPYKAPTIYCKVNTTVRSLHSLCSARFARPRAPLPDQWIHKPFQLKDKYAIPRPLAQLNQDLGADLNQENRAKKYSATRSPSLEKDDKSPFLTSAKVEDEVFGFDQESLKKIETENMLSPKKPSDESPSNLRRFRSVSTRLNMCSVSETPPEIAQETAEMQNSPRVLECSSAKEKSSTSKFDFSPKLLADHMTSPRFFTPPETVSPMFFAEPSPKSVYYDTVRSPKFFPATPRDEIVPQSPKALGDNINRNGMEKPESPRVLSAKASPKVHSYNKENYFTFENAVAESTPRASPRPRKYGGRNSIEREIFTPTVDKDLKKYRRHNSCDTYKNVEVNIQKLDDNKVKETNSEDVVDFCAKIETLQIEDVEKQEFLANPLNTAQARRQRLKSISLDSDNARIIEQNLGLPIAKQMKDQMNEAYKNQDISTSCESVGHLKTPVTEKPIFKFEENVQDKEEEPKSPDIKKKTLRHSSDTQSFIDMPRFSPKEFEITVTTEEGATVVADTHIKRKSRPNLTIDLNKRDEALEKELLEFEKLYTDAEEKKVRTPTLKVKSTSLDSSETVNLSLPQKKTLEIPQNSVSVPNTPKRQLKRILAQKSNFSGQKMNFSTTQGNAERRLYMKGQDSGIFLRENHANLMLYNPGTSRMGSRTMGSFDENIADFEAPEISISGVDNKGDSSHTLGSNLLNYKPNLSVSSTNLKTLPEGVPSDDFEPSAEDEKLSKKLHRRNSNQSLLLSTHSLQSSNCSLSSAGASCHNVSTVRTSLSNFSLSDCRQKKLSLDRSFERRDSNSNTNVSGESKNCLLQRRGSNNSLTLNICSSNNLSRHSSNSSLNKEAKPGQKKGLLERRSSNTSLTLNINNSNPQLSGNRGLSVSNYNLNGSTCNLSRFNSNLSIDNPTAPTETKKGILERRSSNTSLTLNIQPQEPRDLEIDETLLEPNLKDLPHRDKHRKSLSTENLIPKSYKNRGRRGNEKNLSFGSHDDLWSTSYATQQEYSQNLTFVYGDQENEMVYAFGNDPNAQQGFTRNITTKPLSPQSTSEDFRLYLANMQHLQNASSVLTRKQLRDLNDVFQNGYSKVKCHNSMEGQHCCSGLVKESDLCKENPQMAIPDLSLPCSEYQKLLLRNLHQEFWDMPTNFQEKPIVSGSHPKNRYKTILPNEHSRFILKPDAGSRTEGYINANFIKGHEYTKNSYIATQGPLQNTIYDFWLMVYQNSTDFATQQLDLRPPSPPGVQKVVMLTNFFENNRQKCEKYFPLELNEEVSYQSPEYTEATSFFSDTEVLTNSFTIKNVGMVKKLATELSTGQASVTVICSYRCEQKQP